MNPASLRTEFAILPAPFQLHPGSKVLALGSCFAESMGQRLLANKLRASVNPFGTLFQPLALFNLLGKALRQEGPDERLFVEREGRWVSFEAHSEVWGRSPAELAERFSQKLTDSRQYLLEADALLLTLGSAWAYRLDAPPAYVANNHKQPTARFSRDLLSVKEVCKAFASLVELLKAQNPNLSIVLTVSPVRHSRDGMPDNALSKSILRAACHYLTTDYPGVYYFPAYELLLDDLRDYRFYAPDGLHPSPLAEEYIFEKFARACFSAELKTFVAQWQGVLKALAHRPFDETSVAHRLFLKTLQNQLLAFAGQVDVSAELAQVAQRLAADTDTPEHGLLL